MSSDPVALLSRYAQVKNQHDVEGMLALTHEDCQYEDVGAGRTVSGTVELRRYHQHLFAAVPDYQATIDGMAGHGDTAVAWGSFVGTLAMPLFGRGLPGQRIETSAVFVCGFRDGLLHRERAHVDLLTLRRQTKPRGDAFLAAFTDAWSQPTGERLASLFTDDATLQYPRMPAPVCGRPAIRAHFDQILTQLPGVRLEPLAMALSGDNVFVHWRMQMPDADTPALREGIDRFDLRGDRAAKCITHFDPRQRT
ncbi:nuclear transport factor 2 family protein [Streptomyces sp. NBC_01727]|uniref:nuclear transport factor 2 family protein n=1 Tax=Streptomyces sp. NBC_01727 TaxID=2975924 RepID=UPI002E135076|nr:nuclear transport factor 2 family protein [Streptomyces sp. NBC_01727]